MDTYHQIEEKVEYKIYTLDERIDLSLEKSVTINPVELSKNCFNSEEEALQYLRDYVKTLTVNQGFSNVVILPVRKVVQGICGVMK